MGWEGTKIMSFLRDNVRNSNTFDNGEIKQANTSIITINTISITTTLLLLQTLTPLMPRLAGFNGII